MFSQLIVALISLILVHGPKGQEIRLNVNEISSIRQVKDQNHFAEDAHCLIFMNNGKFVLTQETCLEIVKMIAALDTGGGRNKDH